VTLKDCEGDASTHVTGSDARVADVLIVFLGRGCRTEEMHGHLLVWAWRLRDVMRTIFVYPRFDETFETGHAPCLRICSYKVCNNLTPAMRC
jgi:hypothetical protein